VNAFVTEKSACRSAPFTVALPVLAMKEIWQTGGTTSCWMLFHWM
jgi:hypothetical protein